MPVRQLGFIPDSSTQRAVDLTLGRVYTAAPEGTIEPTAWREQAPIPIRDQGRSNFCVRFAMTRALEHLEAMHEGEFRGHFSPLFLAWFDAIPEWRGQNEGTQIYRSAEALNQYGVCGEAAMPWERHRPDDYLDRMKYPPKDHQRQEALRHQVVKSYRINDGDVASVFSAISKGFAVVFGCPVNTGFTTDAAGVLRNSGTLTGYHAMCARDIVMVGDTPMAGVDNSWSRGWGQNGACKVPPEEIQKWMDIRVVTGMEGVR